MTYLSTALDQLTKSCHLLKFQGTKDPFNAKLDKNPVPEVLAYISVHATTKENASTMDDGDSRDIKENTSWSPT